MIATIDYILTICYIYLCTNALPWGAFSPSGLLAQLISVLPAKIAEYLHRSNKCPVPVWKIFPLCWSASSTHSYHQLLLFAPSTAQTILLPSSTTRKGREAWRLNWLNPGGFFRINDSTGHALDQARSCWIIHLLHSSLCSPQCPKQACFVDCSVVGTLRSLLFRPATENRERVRKCSL